MIKSNKVKRLFDCDVIDFKINDIINFNSIKKNREKSYPKQIRNYLKFFENGVKND